MSDPTIPAGLAALLQEPGWVLSRDSAGGGERSRRWSRQFGQTFVSVQWDTPAGDVTWWAHTVNAYGELKPFEVYGAADLMRRIEQAIEPEAALAPEGT